MPVWRVADPAGFESLNRVMTLQDLVGIDLPKGLNVVGVNRLMDAIVKATGAAEGQKAPAGVE